MTMTSVYSKALDLTIEVDRIIDKIDNGKKGPCLIFTGGIHGNEPSGVFALQRVFKKLREDNVDIQGSVYAISGNLWALERGERFQEQDLNRIWTKQTFELLEQGNFVPANQDQRELADIYQAIMGILDAHDGPFYFFDLHTTSSETMPFLTVNDSLLNRKFSNQYPSPIILGIEEYLDGPLLSALNELGYVAFGFEGGQHDDLAAIENHEAFIRLSMAFAGSMEKDSDGTEHAFQILERSCQGFGNFYEIFYRKGLSETDTFEMKPGFVNFQLIRKREILATCNGQPLLSKWNANIFMPLYQKQGNDGFFMIRKIPTFWLQLSSRLRKSGFVNLIALLPGVKWAEGRKDVLIVNTRVAKILSKQLFHLLGFRSKQVEEDLFIMKSREYASREHEYDQSNW